MASRASIPPVRADWLSGLDGLRAVAVLAVLLFHGDLGAFSGGFLGVDVFFVISGFLITTLLLREHAVTGRIDLVGFWRRRARRLLPALFLVLAAVVVFSAIAVPDVLARLRVDVLAALAYATNWYLIVDHQSYFETVGRPSLFRHLWSLAVEEQFYLLWPIVLAVALLIARRRGALVLTLIVAVGSIVWTAALFDRESDPSRVYYGTDTRLFALLIGAALAFAATSRLRWRTYSRRSPVGQPRFRWPDLVAGAGLVLLAWAFVAVDLYDPFLYPWGSVAVALVAAGVIAGATHQGGHIGSRVIDIGALRWIGRRSYGIYLWHWPIFMLTRPGLDVPLSPSVDFALRLALTLVAAEASYRFVEQPIRRGGLAAFGQRVRSGLQGGVWARAGTLALAASVVVAVVLVTGRVIAAPSAPPPDFITASSFQGVASAESPAPTDVALALPSPTGSPAIIAGPNHSSSPAAAGGTGAHPTAAATSAAPGRSHAAGASSAQAASPAVSPAPVSASVPPTSYPAPTASPPPLDADVFAIGDSVLLGAAPELGRALGKVEIDAEIGRQMEDALKLLDDRRAAHRLPDVVIVHLGNNGPVTSREVHDLFDVLDGVPHVIVLTVRISDDFEAHNNKIFAQIARDHPNVTLVDWHAISDGRNDLFWKDGEHLRPEGADVYAELIASAVRDDEVSTR